MHPDDIHFFPLGSGHPLFSSRKQTSIIFQQKVDINLFFSQELLLQLGRGHPLFSSRKWSMDTLFLSQELDIYFLFSQESNIPKILDNNYFLKWGGGERFLKKSYIHNFEFRFYCLLIMRPTPIQTTRTVPGMLMDHSFMIIYFTLLKDGILQL